VYEGPTEYAHCKGFGYGGEAGLVRVGRIGMMIVLATATGLLAGCRDRSGPADPPRARASTVAAAPTTGAPDGTARFAPQVRTRAREARINPQLLMAILYNEAYKPHNPALERAWQKIHPDSAFGVANMHKAAFDEAKQGRDFADRDWRELPDDPDLAIKAAAWHLHDLAEQLPANRSDKYTKDELLALGYNAGAGSMKAFARGAKPGTVAQSYLDRLRENWDKAGAALRTG
jgi:Transglycosylase SLT domain